MDVGRAVARVHGRQDAGLSAFSKQSGAGRVRLGVPSGGLAVYEVEDIADEVWIGDICNHANLPAAVGAEGDVDSNDTFDRCALVIGATGRSLSRREDLRAAGVGSPGQWLSLVLGRGSSASLWPALAIPTHVSHCSGCGGTAPAVSAPNAPAAIIDAGTAVLRFIILLIMSSLVWGLSKPTRMLVGDKAKQPRI